MHEWSDRRQLQRGEDFHFQHNAEYKRCVRERAADGVNVPEFVILRVHLGELVRLVAGIELSSVQGGVVRVDGDGEARVVREFKTNNLLGRDPRLFFERRI
jgi:hypothetical protein